MVMMSFTCEMHLPQNWQMHTGLALTLSLSHSLCFLSGKWGGGSAPVLCNISGCICICVCDGTLLGRTHFFYVVLNETAIFGVHEFDAVATEAEILGPMEIVHLLKLAVSR